MIGKVLCIKVDRNKGGWKMETTYEMYDRKDEQSVYYSGLEKTDPHAGRFFSIIRELNEISDKAVSRRLRTEMVLDWRDEYNVGVREIDSQHKKIFKMIRKLSDLHLKRSTYTDEAVQRDRLLDELLHYAEFHFHSEEQLMTRYEYPMLQQQRQEHKIILSELNRQVTAIRSAHGSTAKLIYFLIQWFIKHTVYSDKDVGLFILRQRKAQAFRFNLTEVKDAARKVTGFLCQPLTVDDVMNFLNQPLNIWGDKGHSPYPVA